MHGTVYRLATVYLDMHAPDPCTASTPQTRWLRQPTRQSWLDLAWWLQRSNPRNIWEATAHGSRVSLSAVVHVNSKVDMFEVAMCSTSPATPLLVAPLTQQHLCQDMALGNQKRSPLPLHGVDVFESDGLFRFPDASAYEQWATLAEKVRWYHSVHGTGKVTALW